ncbi:MAG TPA: alanine racemase [Steroidobacteraceae bacterium]|nr:alanine racemase [Steroidobacteraceae bacterium]
MRPPSVNNSLSELETPCLVLDEPRMERNIERLKRHLHRLGVPLRPHVKTAKCAEVVQRMLQRPGGPITVSTLKEAEQFAAIGLRDILYAVGIEPGKLTRVAALRRQGVDLCVILDSLEQAQAVAAAARATNDRIPALIELDPDGHRAGVAPRDPRLVQIGAALISGGAELRGVMTHSGGSYSCRGGDQLSAAAERERSAAVGSAEMLRAAGMPCPVVSVGSTPAALSARDLTGVTEVRAGVFVFFDLVMAGIGVCAIDDIAISVLASVIGHQRQRGQILVDAGWTALSRDRGTADQPVDQGYGLVCDQAGRVLTDCIVTAVNQEHGIISLRPGSGAPLPELPVGARVRILPNHACATATQHGEYAVVGADPERVAAVWRRFSGW